MFIEKGTQVFLSVKGTKGFLYPTIEWVTTQKDTQVSVLSYVGSDSKRAVLIDGDAIDKDSDSKYVVWINK